MPEIVLSNHEAKTFTRLHFAAEDLAHARMWARQLLDKNWVSKGPWSRGKGYLHQSAFVTAMIVAYGRVFSIGKSGMTFPKKLIPYDADEMSFHDFLLEMRNKTYAHSDLENRSARPWGLGDQSTVISVFNIYELSRDQVERFLKITEKLQDSIRDKCEEILEPYQPFTNAVAPMIADYLEQTQEISREFPDLNEPGLTARTTIP